jgi:hypothetical protein
MWNHDLSGCFSRIRACYGSRFGLYVLMVFFVLYASRLQIRSKSLLLTGTNEVTQALRISAILIMEQNEYQMLRVEEQRDQDVVQRYKTESHEYMVRTQYDKAQELRSRTRSDYYERLSGIDSEYENTTYYKFLYEDRIRLELVQNITQEEDIIATLQQQQDDLEASDSPCHSWIVYETFCTLVRMAVPDRQRIVSQKNAEIQNLVQERMELQDLEREEFINDLVATILQGYATKYNHTANELLQQSKEWDMQMKHDYQMAHFDRDVADQYEHAEQDIQKQLEQELQWQESNRLKANTLFHNATYHIQLSRNYIKYTTVIGLLCFVYFLGHLIKTGVTFIKFYSQQDRSDEDGRHESIPVPNVLWYSISYVIQHVLIFLVICGFMDTNYLFSSLDTLSTETHIVWIALLAFYVALFQTVLLHTLPHLCFGIDYPLNYPTIRAVSIHFFGRMVFAGFSIALEFLIAWLSLRNLFLTEENLKVYRHGLFILLVIVSVTLHIIILGKRHRMSVPEQYDEQATILLGSDDGTIDDEMSSATSIDTISVSQSMTSSNATEGMPLIFLRGFLTQSRSQSVSSNPRRMNSFVGVDVLWELLKLLFLMDLLFVACSVMMLYYDITRRAILVLVILLGGVAALANVHSNFARRSELSNTISSHVEKHTPFTKSFNTYNSIQW